MCASNASAYSIEDQGQLIAAATVWDSLFAESVCVQMGCIVSVNAIGCLSVHLLSLCLSLSLNGMSTAQQWGEQKLLLHRRWLKRSLMAWPK